ncbi:hypothetical protein [Bradyrhizobium sp. 2TAF24]|uniref:hypothetical protein n=1 Tax=Bradyrhizobium sp. 2TAF24 TaxID=3233011 RepID=UPI003F933DCC
MLLTVVDAAIRAGHGSNSVSVLQRLRTEARDGRDADQLLKIADDFFRVDQAESAKEALVEALAVRPKQGGVKNRFAWDLAARLAFQLDGDVVAVRRMLAPATDQDASEISVAIIGVIARDHPGEAVSLASEIADPSRRLGVLESIANRLAGYD